MSIMGRTNSAAVKIYQVTYLFGVVLGSILYYSANKIFPPEGLGIEEDFDGLVNIDGVAPSEEAGSGSITPTKGPEISDSEVPTDSKA